MSDGTAAGELEGLARVRARPAMFVGSLGERGLYRVLAGLIDNSVEEAVLGHANTIRVTLLPDGGFGVTDDGPGLPAWTDRGHSQLTRILTRLDTNARSGPPVASGSYALPLAVLNAVCEHVEVESKWDGYTWTQRFSRGIPEGPVVEGARVKDTGTTIRAVPDADIFETSLPPLHRVRNRLQTLAYLVPALRLELDEGRGGASRVFVSTDGVGELVQQLNLGRDVVHHPISISSRSDALHLDVGIQYRDSVEAEVLSFANHQYTPEGGSHENAFRRGLSQALAAAFRADGRMGKCRLRSARVWEGCCAVVSLRVPNPGFEGSRHQALYQPGLENWIAAEIREGLKRHARRDRDSWASLAERVWSRVRYLSSLQQAN